MYFYEPLYFYSPCYSIWVYTNPPNWHLLLLFLLLSMNRASSHLKWVQMRKSIGRSYSLPGQSIRDLESPAELKVTDSL